MQHRLPRLLRRRTATLVIAGIAALLGVDPASCAEAPAQRNRPNVVLIMADDLGYECLGCNGGTSYATPNLDRLATGGARFTHCYVNPICTPTRAALMTGQYMSRVYENFGNLPRGRKTFGHMMREAGYATCVVGKWQLAQHGGQTPDEAGFDEHFMKIDSDSAGYADPVVYSDGSKPERRPGEYGPDLFCEYMAGFMERHRDRPFFVYYPMFLTHFDFTPTPDSPEWASGDRLEKHPRFFADMVVYMDKNVGRIVAKLDELGLREKTLVIYLADNGTHPAIVSRMGEREVRGEKGLLTPAGTHEPLIVNWPGVVPAGQVRDDLVDPTDFLPTIAEATGATLPEPTDGGRIDGHSFWQQVTQRGGRPRSWALVEYTHENRGKMFWGHEGRYARDQRWKLYDAGTSARGMGYYRGGQLYDLERDPGLQNPITADADTAETAAARARLQRAFDKHPVRPEHRPADG